VVWSGRSTSGAVEPGASNVFTANTGSSVLFQLAMPPCSNPHMASAPANRWPYRSASPVVIIPPSEVPHAIARAGRPNRVANVSSVDIWSGSAFSSTQPVSAYDEPISA
jgi:hypothetical protein